MTHQPAAGPKVHDPMFDGQQGGLTNCRIKFETANGARRRVLWNGSLAARVAVAETRAQWDEACRQGRACLRCVRHNELIAREAAARTPA